jgi:hypothetical protein
MLKLTIDQIISNIEAGVCFEGVSEDYSFTIKISDYVHYLCGAVHDGHQLRKELWSNCTHSEFDRWHEDDPCTKQMVQSHPIVIAGLDSRFEYDLNREPELAIYEDAWGKPLWKQPLSDLEGEISLIKHNNFYRVVHALIQKLETLFGCAVVYDMHSYNWRRWEREVPTWNLGTSNVDQDRYGNSIESWRQELSRIELQEGIPRTAKINDTFYGNGYFLRYITENFKNTLVLATEVAKIYCDETRFVVFPEVVNAIEQGLKESIPRHAEEFKESHNNS